MSRNSRDTTPPPLVRPTPGINGSAMIPVTQSLQLLLVLARAFPRRVSAETAAVTAGVALGSAYVVLGRLRRGELIRAFVERMVGADGRNRKFTVYQATPRGLEIAETFGLFARTLGRRNAKAVGIHLILD